METVCEHFSAESVLVRLALVSVFGDGASIWETVAVAMAHGREDEVPEEIAPKMPRR